MQTHLHRRGPRVSADGDVVGSFFGGLFRKFGHLFKHFEGFALEFIAPAFGIPPGVAGSLATLILHAHAGNKKAKAKVEAMAARDPKVKAAAKALNAKIQAHPDFTRLQAHART